MRKKERYLTVGDILVSPDIITHHFACDLDACKGACCIEGEEGAPVAEEEKPILLETLPRVIHRLPSDNVDYMLSHGVLYSPVPGAWATMIVDGGRCVFTSSAPGECCRCVFEQSSREGLQDRFLKPLSCHLYPIRVRRTDAGQTVLYYDVWVTPLRRGGSARRARGRADLSVCPRGPDPRFRKKVVSLARGGGKRVHQ